MRNMTVLRNVFVAGVVLLLLCCMGCISSQEPKQPSIETSEHYWNGFKCVVPNGFAALTETTKVYMTAPAVEQDSNGLDVLSYDLVSNESVLAWDDEPFSSNHVRLLLSVFNENDIGSYNKHSINTTASGIKCYHLVNNSENKYYCFAKVYSDKHNALVLIGIASSETGIAVYDAIVDTMCADEVVCEPTADAYLEFERIDSGIACLYAIDGIAYLEVDDTDISREKTDYEFWGAAEDGTKIYRLKGREIVLLIEEPRSTAPVIAVRTDSDYWD